MAAPNTQSTVLDAFGVELLSAIHKIREPVTFAAGERIFEKDSLADAFYIIDDGEVAIEVPTPDVDTDPVLDTLVAGDFLGEEALLGGAPHWSSAVAVTDVEAVRVSASDLRRMYKEQPEEGVAVLRAMARYTANRLRDASARVAESLADDQPDAGVEEMVATAERAQAEFESWPEERVDALLEDIATSINDRAAELAADTVAETTLGNADHKVAKIQFGTMSVLETLRGEVAAGTVGVDEERRVREIAAPVGVIFALVPVTNPVPTIANKTLIALKGRNSIILSTHRMAQGVGDKTGQIILEALRRHDAPDGLVQWVRGRTSRRRTAKFMRHDGVSLVLATGGPGMVKAAYSSGTPAIGVGAGNAPAWVSADADPVAAAQAIVISKSFDNGLICGSEQHIVVDASLHDRFVEALQEAGAAVLTREETAQVVERAFDDHGHLLIQYVGRSAATFAELAGLPSKEGASILVFPVTEDVPEEALGRERLAPVCSLFTVDGDDEAIALCRRLLSYEGAGHTAVVHTSDPEREARFAAAIPAGRILVNVPATLGFCGVVTGLQPSFTLGCGTFGGNSTTDNVGYKNLLNLKRVAHPTT
jgi:acyl-CoA reductase-like NAD-dependent aldehyde dehydrogenase